NGLFTAPATAAQGRVAYEDGSLVIDYSRHAAGDPAAMPALANRPVAFSNGVIDVEARVTSETDRAGFNVGFRRNGEEGYFLWVSPRRKLVQFLKRQGTTLSELATANVDALLPDGSNRVTIVADGPTLQLYVNGQLALTTQDGAFT